MNSAKPFVCPAIGCNQQFANEDHLEVHRRKHEMSLGLRDFKSSLDTPVIADQTPTPTRFLKNCEEVGLFSDLPNPFDESFREASKFHHVDPESNNNAHDEHNDADKTTISDDDDGDVDDLDANSPTDAATVGDTSSTTITASPQAVSSTTEEEAAHIAETLHPHVITTTAPSAIPLTITKTVQVQKIVQQPQVIQQHQQIIAVQPQAIAAATNGQSVLAQVAVSGATMVVPPVSAQSILTTAGSEMKVSLANIQMPFMNTIPISAPILLRLPNGQTIPVVPPSVANPAVQIPLAVSAMEPQTTQASEVANDSNVKMKLKNALLTSQSQGNMGVMTQAVEVVTRQQQAVTSTSIALPPKSEYTVMQVSPGKRRKSQEQDGDVKRMRFLERNRAAATRCRNKRKQWINNLEEKADDLNSTNSKLQNEVTTLRNEVAQLKQLLLAHKDCPVTVMQRKAQVQILPGSGAADLQAVSAVSAEEAEEVMEIVTTVAASAQPVHQHTTVITAQTLAAPQGTS